MTITPDTMRIAYQEVMEWGIYELVRDLKSDPTARNRQGREYLRTFFKNLPLWDELPTKSGHLKWKHRLSQVTVGFQGHAGGKNESTIPAAQAMQLYTSLQKHMNYIGNEVFAYNLQNWKSEPNYALAARRFSQLHGAERRS